MTAAIRAAAPHLGHIHLAESNRMYPGAGHTDFGAVITALRGIGFAEGVGERARERRHGGGDVPKVRIVARLPVDELGHRQDRPLDPRRDLEQLVHPGIVIGAVEDND